MAERESAVTTEEEDEKQYDQLTHAIEECVVAEMDKGPLPYTVLLEVLMGLTVSVSIEIGLDKDVLLKVLAAYHDALARDMN